MGSPENSGPGRGENRACTTFLALGAAAVVVYWLMPSGLGQNLVYVAIGLASVAAILMGVRMNRPGHAIPWVLMAVGQLVWTVGDALGVWDANIVQTERFPAPSDAAYLLAYPLLAVSLLMLLRGRRPRGDLASLLDSAIVTVALSIISWVFLAQPLIFDSGYTAGAAAVAVAYPLADIVLISLVIAFVSMPGRRAPSMRLLIGALLFLIVADTLGSALGLLTFDATKQFDFLWLVSYVLWGAAALHPSMRTLSTPLTAPVVRFSRPRLVALTTAVLVAPATLAVEHVARLGIDVWAIVIGSVTMFSLVVARMRLAINQISAAHEDLARLQQDLTHQAAHDSLTGLPNRAQAMRLIEGALSRAQRSGAVIGLLFVDLDGFKKINDTHGHGAGDEVLTVVSDRMADNVRSGDVVARLGGDEFVVLLEPLDTQASAVDVAERLVAAVAEPVTLSTGRTVRLGASVGVAVSQDAGTDADALLQEADVAVYRAKTAGRGRTEVFDASLRRELDERSEIEAGLGAAIRADELVLHYQPIFGVEDQRVQGFEALVRWQRPGVGLVPPAAFVGVAEQSDLICELDAWVLRAATTQLAAWNAASGTHPLTVAVNVSRRHVGRSRFCGDVTTALERSGLPARLLVLEISESALGDDLVALTNLADLRTLGVSISIDDFGTGYNSIAQLENLPVNIVKIDKRFLDPATPSSDKLLQLIVSSAHAFGLPVVADGVEDETQLEVLRTVRCESAQGYLLGHPMDAAGIEAQVLNLRATAQSGG